MLAAMSHPSHPDWSTTLAQARAFAPRDPNGALTRTRALLAEIDAAIAQGDTAARDFRAQVAAEHASHQAAVAQLAAEAIERREAYHARIRRENAGEALS
jgi:hypothetical protein